MPASEPGKLAGRMRREMGGLKVGSWKAACLRSQGGSTAFRTRHRTVGQGWFSGPGWEWVGGGGIERHSTPRESGLSYSRRLRALVMALLYRSVFSWEIMTFPR